MFALFCQVVVVYAVVLIYVCDRVYHCRQLNRAAVNSYLTIA